MHAQRRLHDAAGKGQRGAIALMFSLLLVVLLAAGGIVLDLGHLYVLKSELQNAADSAALAGADEIDLTATGIDKAAAKAISFAGEHKYDFGSALVLTNADVTFSSSPDGPWSSVGEAKANPNGKSFIKVDTGSKSVPTSLMGTIGIMNMATLGSAVAGRFVVDITPLGLCAQSTTQFSTRPAGAELELVEYGFRRGMTYNMLAMGPIAGPADPMLLNPVDSPPASCSPSHSSANFTAPFLCQGNSTVASTATEVYANTGVSVGPVEKAINSRFNSYPGGTPCTPATAPPDRNIQPYDYSDALNGAARWMTPANQGEVLWSYSRPVRAAGSAGDYSAGTPFELTDWGDLYGKSAVIAEYPAGTSASPYATTSGQYFLAPSTNTPTLNRRLINMAIVDCSAATSNAMSCKKLPIVGVGRFFLQKPVQLSGSTPGMYVEFAGLIEPVPNSEIKLYR